MARPLQMQRFVFNTKGAQVRHDTMEGREYLVVPMVMLTEGVHAGSEGPLFYPRAELEKVPAVWNHKPIVVYHPQINGVGVSACDPVILSSRKVGVIMNAKTEDGRLKAEAWLEESRLKTVDNRVFEALEANEMVEVSTGLFPDSEDAPGVWNSEPYNAIVRNIRPDHLAILPDQKGACSIADGAGLLRNSASPDEGLSTRIGKALVNALRPVSNELTHWEINSKLNDAIQNGSAMDSRAWVEDVYDREFIFHRGDDLFRQGYTVANDAVVLVGDAVKVEKIVSYKVLDNGEESTAMEKKELIDRVLGNSAWTKEDRPFLEGLSEAQLTKMLPVRNGDTQVPKPGEAPKEPGKADASALPSAQPEPANNATPVTAEQYCGRPDARSHERLYDRARADDKRRGA